jgi:phospholipase C
MKCRASLFCLCVALLLVSCLLVSMNGCGSSSSGSPPPAGAIQHIVIIFQENRTPDNLFHDPVLMANGADIASTGLDSNNNTITLQSGPLANAYDLDHAHSGFVDMYNGGAMNGANTVPVSCEAGATDCPPANPQYYYVQSSDVGPYFQMAEQYTFGDRMFQTNQGPSFPAHQFILSGTSAPSANSNLFVSENPNGGAGCAAAPSSTVTLIDPNGNEDTNPPIYPCFEHPTLPDELDAAGISWRYYAPGAGSIWTAPNAIQHLCGPNEPPPNGTVCQGADWVNDVVLYTTENPAPMLTDIANNNLAAVSWIIPAGQNSDHPGNTTYTGGPSWVSAIVNAIGSSAYWKNTAIIVTWDDWGGWFDHVPPEQVIDNGTSWGSGYLYGFRVPLIVISPYAKPAYISHVPHDFGSILKFIEENFRLSSLGYADAYADDLSDCFNFSQTPLVFQTINAPMDAAHFLNDRSPIAPPDDD